MNSRHAHSDLTADYPPDYSFRNPSSTQSTQEIRSTSSSLPRERRCHSCCRRCASAAFGNLGVCGLVVAYTILGGCAFLALEGGGISFESSSSASDERDKLSAISSPDFAEYVSQLRNHTVERLWSITEGLNILYERNWTHLATQEVIRFQNAVVHAMRSRGIAGTLHPGTHWEASIRDVGGVLSATSTTVIADANISSHEWNFASSLLYALTLITTIGYGHVTPRTAWGKAMTVLYAIVGIPLMLLYLSSVGDFLARSFRRLYGRLCCCCSHQSKKRRAQQQQQQQQQQAMGNATGCHLADGPLKQALQQVNTGRMDYNKEKIVRVPISLCLLIIAGYIVGGAWLFTRLEAWTFVEGSFFCFTALGTIGFGDLVPGRNGRDTSILASTAYILVGMAVIAMCFNLIQDEIVVLARRLGRSVGMFQSGDNSDDGNDDDDLLHS